MWAVDNQTPFAVERGWTTGLDGRDLWIVVVKGTFLLKPDGATEPAPKQLPPNLAPRHRGEPDKTSLLLDTDFVLSKPNTDVLLEGHAWAPGGREAPQVDLMMKVGPIKRIASVFGDRTWKPGTFGMKLDEPKPFAKMPLTWERAFGGTDKIAENPKLHDWEPRNPVGRGFAVRPEYLQGQLAPNLEDPTDLIKSPKQRPKPMGFGPVDRVWMPRRLHAGTFDEKWEKERQPLYPKDFDVRFNQCAPEDQQAKGYLKGGEPVELFNVSASGALRFRLPSVELGLQTRIGDDTIDHRAVLYTVILEPDIPRVALVWHTSVPCHGPKKLKLRETKVTLKTSPRPGP
ncbi:MAG TPA: DUF2169 domain-containing protein [Planctomycetota bacterium]|jgi:hypothetical protein|nr:DUF2169 domain-containing protein [Planctomycetota bacterium]